MMYIYFVHVILSMHLFIKFACPLLSLHAVYLVCTRIKYAFYLLSLHVFCYVCMLFIKFACFLGYSKFTSESLSMHAIY